LRSVLEGSTFGIGSTCVDEGARILTSSIDASIVFRAVIVMSTASYALSILTNVSKKAVSIFETLRWSFSANGIGISSELGGTRTDCCVIDGRALGISSTNSEESTRVLAEPVDTSFLERAVRICSTSDDTTIVFTDESSSTLVISVALDNVSERLTVDSRISDKSWFACADWTVCVGNTIRVGSAGISEGTRIGALSVEASLVRRAMLIVSASLDTRTVFTDESELTLVISDTGRGLDDDNSFADDSRVSLELCRTGADRTMVL